MEREFNQNQEVDKHYTLSELQRLLKVNPDIFGDQLQDIQRAVADAEAELEERGVLSQGMAEELDDLFRPFKPDSLK